MIYWYYYIRIGLCAVQRIYDLRRRWPYVRVPHRGENFLYGPLNFSPAPMCAYIIMFCTASIIAVICRRDIRTHIIIYITHILYYCYIYTSTHATTAYSFTRLPRFPDDHRVGNAPRRVALPEKSPPAGKFVFATGFPLGGQIHPLSGHHAPAPDSAAVSQRLQWYSHHGI